MLKKFSALAMLTCILTLAPAKVRALETDKAAHLGVSYALNTAFYGFNKKALHMDRTNALVFAAFYTLALGFTKEMMDAVERGDERFNGQDMLFNTIGTGLSIGTCIMFEF